MVCLCKLSSSITSLSIRIKFIPALANKFADVEPVAPNPIIATVFSSKNFCFLPMKLRSSCF